MAKEQAREIRRNKTKNKTKIKLMKSLTTQAMKKGNTGKLKRDQ